VLAFQPDGRQSKTVFLNQTKVMSTKSNNIRIGVFVVIALVLLILGLLAFGAKSYLETKTRFETLVDGEVSGLSVGSRVQLRGVPVGHVTKIDFAWNVYPESASSGIVVEFEVKTKILPRTKGQTDEEVLARAVTNGLRAVVKGIGITGTSMLSVENMDPADNPVPKLDYEPNAIFIPSAHGQITRMLDALGKSLDNVQNVNFAAIGESLTNTLQSVARLSDRLAQIDINSLTTNVNSAVVRYDKVGAKLQVMLDQIDAMPVAQTVTEAHQVMLSLNNVLNELENYPSGFIFGQPPLPPKSLAMPAK
jgi:ABC-type transporter Mla subunit MlaD